MERVTNNDIEWLLNLDKKNTGGVRIRERLPYEAFYKQIPFRVFSVAVWLLALLVLPFYLLIRTSVFLNVEQGLSAWGALGAGVITTLLLLVTYLIIMFRKVNNTRLLIKASLVIMSTIVLGFCMFSLFYISGVHAKNPEIRNLYRSMHPVLRIAVTTVTLADGGLVITDIKRLPDDYNHMGLPVNHFSLHYSQKSGYVHAVDLRTRDRGVIRNTLLQLALEGMGFHTLRHTGTADHLHVELALQSK